MKKSILLGLGACALALGGVAAFAGQRVAAETKADTPASGKVTLDMTDYWGKDNEACNVNIYFYDDNKHDGWGTYAYVDKGAFAAEVSYSFSWTPTRMIVLRYSTEITSGWTCYNRTPADQKEGHPFANHLRITGQDDSAVTDYATIQGGVSGQAWSEIATLGNTKVNEGKHCEYYATNVTLTAGQSFKVVYGGVYYGNYSIGDGVSASEFSGGNGSDINIVTGGTYSLFFDAKNKNVHIANPQYAAMDAWAESFNGVDEFCDAGDTDWAEYAASFAALDPEAQAYFNSASANKNGNTIQRAAYRYDNAVNNHGKTPFEDASGNRPSAPARIVGQIAQSDDNGMIILTTIAGFAVLSIACFAVFRRKREN